MPGRGRMGGGIVRESGMDVGTYVKRITKDLPYNRGNCLVLTGSLDGRRVWERVDTCEYMA